MVDLANLLNRYNLVVNEAKGKNPDNRNIEEIVKRHILELASQGGANGAALRNDCGDWLTCNDGSCVPPEVGCF